MNWKKTSEHSISSTCDAYHIAKGYVEGQESYVLWHHRHILGCWSTVNEAKAKAEEHKGQA